MDCHPTLFFFVENIEIKIHLAGILLF